MINWREIPFVRLLMPVILGILSAIYFDYSLPLLNWLMPFFVFSLLILHYQKIDRQFRFVFGLCFNVFFILLAYQLTYYHQDAHHPQFIDKYSSNEACFVLGTIQKMPDKSRENWIKIELDVQKIGYQKDSLEDGKGVILTYLENDQNSNQLAYGDVLMLQSRLSHIQAPKNPAAFDYQNHLKFQNIHFQSFIKKEQWTRLAQRKGYRIFQLAFHLRYQFLETLQKHLPSINEFAVGSALILGYKDELPDELKTAYAGTGAMHVLAVSGLHVGLVYLILSMFLKIFPFQSRTWRWTKIILLIAFIWSFAMLTGASASVLRAATMFTFITYGLETQRSTNIYNTLAASAFCLLLYDPFLLKNVGFQLSYLAVLGIIYFQPKIYRLWIIDHKIGDYLWTLVTVSIAATISTLPMSLLYFHQFPVYFWLSGLVVVPAAAVILSGGILLFGLDWLLPSMAGMIGTFLYGVIWGVNSLIFFIQQLPSGLITGIWIGTIGVVVLYLMMGSIMAAINTKKIKWLLAAFGLLTILSISYAFTTIQQFYKKEIVIYHTYKHTVIDCIDGIKVFSIQSDSIEESNLQFATQNYRWSRKVREVNTFNFSDSTKIFDTWMYQSNLLGFYDIKIAVVDHAIDENAAFKIKVDYLLLRDNPKIYVEKLINNYDFDLLIFDGSNSTWRIEKWKEKCDELKIKYYDINEKGAFVLDITDS